MNTATPKIVLLSALAALANPGPGRGEPEHDPAATTGPTLAQPDAPEEASPAAADPIEAAYHRFMRLREEERLEDATAAALQVAELTRARYGAGAEQLATPLINLAVMQSQTGMLVEAEQNYRAAIGNIEQHHGMLSSRLINPLTGLGHAYNRAGRYEQAIESFDRALHLNNIDQGFTNFNQFGIQDGLTESYVGLRDYDEANFYQETQLEIHRRKFGAEDPRTVPAMYKLAEWYDRAGNLEESVLTYRSADRIIRENESEVSAKRADALLGLARLYERQGNRPAASSTLRKAVRVLDANPEPDRLRRAEVRIALGDLYSREMRFGSARTEYAAAWADLSGDEAFLERRDYFFELPVRLGGGPFPRYAPNTRGRSEPELRDGYIEIRYTVDREGLTQDVTVLESDPPDVMEESLLSTYKRSVYRPRHVDGAAVATENLIARHEFRYAVRVVVETQEGEPLPRPAEDRGRIDYPGETDAD